MKTKIRKTMYIAAAAIFVIGLGINISISLNDPFENVSSLVVAQQSGTDSSGTGWPDWPPTNSLKCRCHNDGKCYGGNYISFRSKCAEFPNGQGDCSSANNNCPLK